MTPALPASAIRDPRGFLKARGYIVTDVFDVHYDYPIRVYRVGREESGRFNTVEEAVLCLANWGRIF